MLLKNFSPSSRLALKLVLEFMPLGLFFIANIKFGYWGSTAVLIVATAVSLVLTWWLFRQLALMAIITAITSIGAGSFTLIWDDPAYVQMKPTIVGFTFAAILAVGLYIKKPLFKILLGQTLYLTDDGWRVLTWLWLAYFVVISILNEFIRFEYSWDFWVNFKVYGLMPLTVIYALPQKYLLKRYQPDAQKAGNTDQSANKAHASNRQPNVNAMAE